MKNKIDKARGKIETLGNSVSYGVTYSEYKDGVLSVSFDEFGVTDDSYWFEFNLVDNTWKVTRTESSSNVDIKDTGLFPIIYKDMVEIFGEFTRVYHLLYTS